MTLPAAPCKAGAVSTRYSSGSSGSRNEQVNGSSPFVGSILPLSNQALGGAPYKIGDFINLDTGERGQVVRIGLRNTRLMTRDDVEITLPNAHLASSQVVNASGGLTRRRGSISK